MKSIDIIQNFLVILAVTCSLTKSASFSYTAQKKWPGICVKQNEGRQSPINIDTSRVKRRKLTPLKFNSAFLKRTEGIFKNTCQNVEFTPAESVKAVVQTPVGKYKLEQFHFHWGRKSGEGTEHLVNRKAEELEIHFVFEKIGCKDPKARDALAVIAVRGEVRMQPIRGIFKKLDASEVTEVDAAIDVSDIVLADLLPRNCDYYFYEGSLTTPDCDEIVQWFVLKHTIKISASYLTQLRKIERDDEGNRLTFNFRAPQKLNKRVVLTPNNFVFL